MNKKGHEVVLDTYEKCHPIVIKDVGPNQSFGLHTRQESLGYLISTMHKKYYSPKLKFKVKSSMAQRK